MFQYVKILLMFILSIVMDKNDFTFGHKDFKPLRVVFLIILGLNVPFTLFLLDVIHDTTIRVEQMCPAALTPPVKDKTKK